MGLKLQNTYYSNSDISKVLKRKGYQVQDDIAFKDGKEESIYTVFRKIVNKRLNQSKQEFLDSL